MATLTINNSICVSAPVTTTTTTETPIVEPAEVCSVRFSIDSVTFEDVTTTTTTIYT